MPANDWKTFKSLIATPDLPDLGPRPRPSRRTVSELNQMVDRFLANPAPPPDLAAALRSAALLWHDHLDASHEISQEIRTRDGSLLHGIMHRREPDYGNAKYWFHRVGNHPAYAGITARVGELLHDRHEPQLHSRLIRGNQWDPFAFIDACEEVAGKSLERVATLQAVQEAEFDSLLAHLLHA